MLLKARHSLCVHVEGRNFTARESFSWNTKSQIVDGKGLRE